MSGFERQILRAMFDAAVAQALPGLRVPPFLPEKPKGRTLVIGAGKASAAMAQALEQHWDGPLTGLVVTRYGHGAKCERIEIVEAAHPVPDLAGAAAAARILAMVRGLSADDLVIALISGGGSSLLSLPAEGLELADKQAINKAMLKSGAAIGEMNCVRKHLSAIKGGRLAAAAFPAPVVTLVISDVPGDDPAAIASGPTVADTGSFAEALAILDKYHIDLPPHVRAHLAEGRDPTIKPGDVRLSRAELRMIATPQMSLEAAAKVARAAGITPYILGDAIEGESSEVAKVMAGMAAQVVRHGQPVPAPCVFISGGETSVTVKGKGRGGRNVEFLLSLAVALDGCAGVYAIAGDTDGIDGIEEVAGGLVTPDSLARAKAAGISAKAMLANNDGHSFFEALNDQVITGPTLTNVNDFRAILVTGRG